MGDKLFDWDNIQVGNHQLDHSENFFAYKHVGHERLFEEFEFVNVKMSQTSLEKENIEGNATVAIGVSPQVKTNSSSKTRETQRTVFNPLQLNDVNDIKKENTQSPLQNFSPKKILHEDIDLTCTYQAKNEALDGLNHEDDADVTLSQMRPPNICTGWTTQKKVITSTPHIEHISSKRHGQTILSPPKNAYQTVHHLQSNDLVERKSNSPQQRSPKNILILKKEQKSPNSGYQIKNEVSNEQNQCSLADMNVQKQLPPNIRTEWSTQKKVVSLKSAQLQVVPKRICQTVPPPHAYTCKDVYQRKKEEALRKRDENERKMREFHSKPVPDFNAIHQKMERRQLNHVITLPITPKVLKKSKESEEMRKMRVEAQKRCTKQNLRVDVRSPAVLREKPFVPKKHSTVIEVRPFNLSTDKRVMERKQFDQATQRAMEERKKQVEIEEKEQKRREEEQIKELRKMARFKARPNPFK